ncbi:MAG: hypothetical protein JJ868_17160 [Shimia sp.]|uniref:hypothetical protein n=1 Tax=Shimia sp. TaxID=1954381 RepID=UPI001AFDCEDB|nr:hypothetical protein [Shimia sp.]MBO6899102.1 hypothetical protein [Shimia sp.]
MIELRFSDRQRFLFRHFVCVFLLIVPTLGMAQSKQDLADECRRSVDEGNLARALEISDTMKWWKHLFDVQLIKSVEHCLSASTGEEWRCFHTKGEFLSGDKAKKEAQYIAGAEERRANLKFEKKRKYCKVFAAEQRVEKLEIQLKAMEAQRLVEYQSKTLEACNATYENDQNRALLNPVCSKVFREFGLPDSKLEFDISTLIVARTQVLQAQLELAEIDRAKGSTASVPKSSELSKVSAECSELLKGVEQAMD